MIGRAMGFALVALALAAPAQAKVGTGWSRASDLAVYQAMDEFGDLAREQDVLCRGRDPVKVQSRWNTRFAARETAVAAALTQRYGANAVSQARTLQGERQPCEVLFDRKWAREHHDLLTLLETRLFAPSVRTRG